MVFLDSADGFDDLFLDLFGLFFFAGFFEGIEGFGVAYFAQSICAGGADGRGFVGQQALAESVYRVRAGDLAE